MEAKLDYIGDDLAYLRAMKSRYDNPELLFIADWLILYLNLEIEEMYE